MATYAGDRLEEVAGLELDPVRDSRGTIEAVEHQIRLYDIATGRPLNPPIP